MVSKIITGLIILGASIVLLAGVLQYLVLVWPLEGADPDRVLGRLVILQNSGWILAVAAAWYLATKATTRARRIRIVLLGTAILALGIVLATNGPQTQTRTSEATAAVGSKYRFSTDWVSDHTTTWKKVLAEFKDRPDVRALEIGTYEGRSALWFLENILTGLRSSITCVDIWNGPFEKTFDENMRIYGRTDKYKKVRARSDQALLGMSQASYDFVYIDGSHFAKDVLTDAVLAWGVLKPGGILMFDDYEWGGVLSHLKPHYTPRIALKAFVQIFGPYMDILESDYQLVVRKKVHVDATDLEHYRRLRAFVVAVQRRIN